MRRNDLGRWWVVPLAAVASILVSGAVADGAFAQGELPDLVPWSIYSLRVQSISEEGGARGIRFGLLTANIGTADWVNPPSPPEERLDPVARFILYKNDAGNWTEVSRHDKRLICNIDSTVVAPCIAGERHYTCTPWNQGITVGWADDYFPSLTGQYVLLGDETSGLFALAALTDPLNHVQELNKENNWNITLFQLDGDTITPLGSIKLFDDPCM